MIAGASSVDILLQSLHAPDLFARVTSEETIYEIRNHYPNDQFKILKILHFILTPG